MAFDEVAVLDRNAEALGVPTRTLMENAGEAIADIVRERAPDGRLVVLCGPGNNGGDGLVCARALADERSVRVVLAGEDVKTDLARDVLEALPSEVPVRTSPGMDDDELADVIAGADVLLDALLGAGAQGRPRGEVARVVEAVTGFEGPILSVDAPTGVGTEIAIHPSVTIALHAPKQVPPQADTGEIVVVDIGIPDRAITHTGPGEFALYPRPERTQHKGQGGFTLVVGGGPYAGAPALSAMAAMRSGADLSFVLVPERAWDPVASFSPNLVARPLEGENLDLSNPKNRVLLNKWLGTVDSVAIGPGLGKMEPVNESVPLVVERVLELGLPLCADADALWALRDADVSLEGRAVLTPHAKEFEGLTGRAVPAPDDVEGRVKVARQAARELHATVLLKGPVDVIADAERVKRNTTGTPAMSHGGTGDILTGIVAGLLAKGMRPFDAARLGAYLSGKAGEHATDDKSYGMLATDVLEEIPTVLRSHLD